MFKKLREKWEVSNWGLFFILCTFACGGSASGHLTRLILGLVDLERGLLYVIAYLLLVTLLWAPCVLLISIPFGQFNFFRRYLAKLGRKIVSRKGGNNARFQVSA